MAKRRRRQAPKPPRDVKAFETTIEELDLGSEQQPGPQQVYVEPSAERTEPATEAAAETLTSRGSQSLSLEMLATMWKVPFDWWADQVKVRDLAITQAEARDLARPTQILLEKYLPTMDPTTAAWMALAASIAAIVGSRLLILQAVRAQRAAKDAAKLGATEGQPLADQGVTGWKPQEL